ncbi:MAG: TetR/AcrR family transcriptional regulator [Candidatus Ornithomonoglobus sp.]
MDRRIEKTENAFTDALFHFLREKELNKITVKELCDYADMNRGTFYLHYYDIYDLMDKTEQKMVDKIFEEGQIVALSLSDNVLKTFQYIKEHKEEYKVLLTSHNINGFIDKLSKKIISSSKSKLAETLPGVDAKILKNITLFYVGGAAALLYGWVVENDCSTSAAELLGAASYLFDIMHEEKQRLIKENPAAL